jgi:hypothetical protein
MTRAEFAQALDQHGPHVLMVWKDGARIPGSVEHRYPDGVVLFETSNTTLGVTPREVAEVIPWP